MDRIKDRRIYDLDGIAFDRGDRVTINLEGKRLAAFATEPVAVAMFAWGVPVMMRSFKYHRPRGIFCLNGKCASCLMRIDGVPNRRACLVRCKQGMLVQRQSGFPNASDDLFALNDVVFPKHLDYHHLLTKPPWVNKMMAGVVREFSGMGPLPEKAPDRMPVIRDIECDVLVIGAGPAGIAASLAAASAKASVILVDDHHRPGGHLLAYPELIDEEYTGLAYCTERAALLIEKGVRFFNENEVIGFYEEGFFVTIKEGQLIRLHPKRTILATGGYDQNFLFPQSDLANIFSARGLAKLTFRWGVSPGDRLFVLGSNDQALSLAMRLPEYGVKVLGIAEPGDRLQGNPDWAQKIQSRGVPLLLNTRPTRAIGRFSLKGIELETGSGRDRIKARCDAIAVAAPLAPAFELASQAGVKVIFDDALGGYVPQCDDNGRTNVPEIFVAGEIIGEKPVAACRREGRIAGFSAALDLFPSRKVQAKLDQIVRGEAL